MKCVTYNIQYCTGLDGKVDQSRIIEEVSGADVIALQEVERFWPRSGNIDQVKVFQDHFSEYYCVYGAGVDINIPGTAPSDRRTRQFGNMILSRFPIEFSRHHLLPKRGSIGPLSIQRSAVEVTVRVNETPLRIYSVHLTHLSAETRLPQVTHLMNVHEHAVHEGYPVAGDVTGKDWESGISNQDTAMNALIFGDFNFQPDSKEYDQVVGPISDYGGHITSPDGFVDAWCHCGHEKMEGHTSTVNGKPARLDYCFVSAPIRHCLEACRVDINAKGSDHLPVWVELSI
jgi:endonuclease/exonuclease/phosphatase family metal-dependent hydrolase